MLTVLNFQNSGKIKTDILREFNTPYMPHATDMSQMCNCITVLITCMYIYKSCLQPVT